MLSDEDVQRIARAVADELDERKEARRAETATSRQINNCDGCQRGIPVEAESMGGGWMHRDPNGNWWNNQSCTAHRYGHKPHGVE